MPISISESLKHIKSTKSHRDIQRFCLGVESFSALVNPTSVAASTDIPLKIAQVYLSGQAFFKPKLKPLEHTAHAIQALTALAQVIVLSMLFFEKNECSDKQNTLCLWATFLYYIYNSTLLVGWAPAELNKEEYSDETASTISTASNSDTSSIGSLSFRTAQTSPPTPKTLSDDDDEEAQRCVKL